MGLYRCEECGCVENTALARFHMRRMLGELKGRALCSECDPGVGQWHGRFPKQDAMEAGFTLVDGGPRIESRM